jgi:hypothetical protein
VEKPLGETNSEDAANQRDAAATTTRTGWKFTIILDPLCTNNKSTKTCCWANDIVHSFFFFRKKSSSNNSSYSSSTATGEHPRAATVSASVGKHINKEHINQESEEQQNHTRVNNV